MRLVGIDTPEINGACEFERQLAIRARQFLLSKLQGGGRVEIQPVARDKYFRILALVSVDGQDLADEMVSAGLAVSYSGGTKRPWCPPSNRPSHPVP
ncbi:MAG: thermonuclease family protein [Nitrospiraceae bacterium]|nr:thermonuclease family protein [Nitrospiraceae bacterium]